MAIKRAVQTEAKEVHKTGGVGVDVPGAEEGASRTIEPLFN